MTGYAVGQGTAAGVPASIVVGRVAPNTAREDERVRSGQCEAGLFRPTNPQRPRASVCMITYNHEKYIAQAIESVLMQKTDFDFEVVIGEDGSADGTADIVRRMAERCRPRIRPLLRDRNLGAQRNFVDVLQHCRGDYVAVLEGDDYWTDPHKLQKQVDFLETHPDFVMCCHDAEMSCEGVVDRSSPFKKDFPQVSTFDDIWRKFFIPTPSLVFRNRVIREFPEWYCRVRSGDRALELMLAHSGKCYYMFEKMAMKRRHPGGITETESFKDTLGRLRDRLTIYRGVMDYTGRSGAMFDDTVGGLHRRISIEYARRHDRARSAYHLAAALFLSRGVRYDVLVRPFAVRVPASTRRLLRKVVPRRTAQGHEQRGAS